MYLKAEQNRLASMSVTQLRQRYHEACGEPTRSGSKPWLVKRILWHLQAHALGDISQRARQKALALARQSELRKSPPEWVRVSESFSASAVSAPGDSPDAASTDSRIDERLPKVGSELVKRYKGQEVRVLVLDNGFVYRGVAYRSLSAVAKQITGASHINGYAFFNLTKSKVGE